MNMKPMGTFCSALTSNIRSSRVHSRARPFIVNCGEDKGIK